MQVGTPLVLINFNCGPLSCSLLGASTVFDHIFCAAECVCQGFWFLFAHRRLNTLPFRPSRGVLRVAAPLFFSVEMIRRLRAARQKRRNPPVVSAKPNSNHNHHNHHPNSTPSSTTTPSAAPTPAALSQPSTNSRQQPQLPTALALQQHNPNLVDADGAVPLPPADPERDEMNRRLSLDGDLPESARRPDQNPATANAAEGLVRIDNAAVYAHMQVAGCSEAGWEPAKPDPNVAHQQVLEVRKENQDAYAILAPFAKHSSVPNLGKCDSSDDAAFAAAARHMIFVGVFDGHGAEGRAIAHFVRDNIARMTLEMAAHHPMATADCPPSPGEITSPTVTRDVHRIRMEALRSAFSRAERGLTDESNRIDHLFSGTTAVVSWMFRDDVYTAWAGDSRCIVGRAAQGDDGRIRYRPIDLSHDQKPSRADEKKRVKSAGGRVARWRRNIGPLRVWLPRDWIPGLAMTRSIGDTVLSEYGVSPVPEVTYTRLCPADAFMVLASDGVWEFMTSQEVVDFVGKMLADGATASETSTALVREAVRKWRRNEVVVDDTTAVVMHLRVNPSEVDQRSNGVSGGKETVDANGVANGGVEPLPAAGKGVARLEKSVLGKKMLAIGRGKHGRVRAATNGTVALVADDGRLADFICKNDQNTGA